MTVKAFEEKLGTANGYVRGLVRHGNIPSGDRLRKASDILGVSEIYLMTGEQSDEQPKWYINEETARIAQDIAENKDLKLLFDAARDATPDDLRTVHTMLAALKKKEMGSDDPA